MKIETLLGAFIAAIISGLTAAIALLTGDNVNSMSDISSLQWTVLGIGVALTFFKDFQALSTRRTIAKVTGTGNAHGFAGFLLAGVLALTLLGGCANHPKVDSVSDAIAVAAADIETVATEVRNLCGNTQPGGDCQPNALITTAQKEAARMRLQQALDAVILANSALATNNRAEAEGRLSQAEALLRLLEAFIQEKQL